jgi:predicted ArsR family transcriptional regulator
MLHRDELLDSTRGRVVAAIRRGAVTVDEIATELGLTGNAVRAQLASLLRDGLIQAAGTRRGVTRPAQTYELTPRVEQLLSRAYVPLLTELVGVLAATQPGEQFDELMRMAGRRLAGDLSGLPFRGPLAERAASAGRLMDRELGASTRVEPEDGHSRRRLSARRHHRQAPWCLPGRGEPVERGDRGDGPRVLRPGRAAALLLSPQPRELALACRRDRYTRGVWDRRRRTSPSGATTPAPAPRSWEATR